MKTHLIGQHKESVAETMERIGAAVQAGSRLQPKTLFEKDLNRIFQSALRLGNGNLSAGLSELMRRQAQAHEQRREQERAQFPVYALLRQMRESPNPLYRAAVRALASLADLPGDEFRRLSNKVFEEELVKATASLPTVLSPARVLPPIEDPTDQRIWDWIQENPKITDAQLGARLNLRRQAVNVRRRALEKMGYPVRRVSRQKH